MPKKTAAKARSRVKKTQSKSSRKSTSLWFFPSRLKIFRGDASIYVILGIILLGAAFFVGGVLPKFSDSTLDKMGGEGQIDPDSLPKGGSKESLQLKTLKFKRCTESAAVEFLLDNSGSMGGTGFDPAKMTNLKSGVGSFGEKLSDGSVVALRTFSDSTTLRVPFDYLKTNRSSFTSAVSSMVPYGSTHQKDAFLAAKGDVEKAVKDYSKYDFNVIFFSDGIPETAAGNRACTGTVCDTTTDPLGRCRCMAPDQDPTSVASEIKAIKNGSGSNVRIFSILLFDPVRDSFAESQFKTLMKSVATDSSTYFETTNPEDLKSLFDQVIKKVCD